MRWSKTDRPTGRTALSLAFPARGLPAASARWPRPCACRCSRSLAPRPPALRAQLLLGKELAARPAVAWCCAARRTALTSWTWTVWPRSRRRSRARRAPAAAACGGAPQTAVGASGWLQRCACGACCFPTALADEFSNCRVAQREQIAAQREAIARQRAALEAQQSEVVQSSSSACPGLSREPWDAQATLSPACSAGLLRGRGRRSAAPITCMTGLPRPNRNCPLPQPRAP